MRGWKGRSASVSAAGTLSTGGGVRPVCSASRCCTRSNWRWMDGGRLPKWSQRSGPASSLPAGVPGIGVVSGSGLRWTGARALDDVLTSSKWLRRRGGVLALASGRAGRAAGRAGSGLRWIAWAGGGVGATGGTVRSWPGGGTSSIFEKRRIRRGSRGDRGCGGGAAGLGAGVSGAGVRCTGALLDVAPNCLSTSAAVMVGGLELLLPAPSG